MSHELTDEQLGRIVEALRHKAAYMKATNRDDRPYLEIAEQLEQPRKSVARETKKPAARRREAK